MNTIPLILLLVPLMASGLIVAGLPAWRVAFISAWVNLLLALVLAFAFPAGGGYHFATNVPWLQGGETWNVNFHIAVDGISLALVLLTTLVSVVAVGISDKTVKRPKEFFICLQMIVLGALGAFLSVDLFFMFLFHEIALVPTFLMIGIWGGQGRKYAASQMALYLVFGSLVIMAGMFALYFALPVGARTFDVEQIRQWVLENPLPLINQQWIAGLLVLGFGVLVSLFPFHSWAPQGYASAPPAVAMLHAGVLKKFGIFALLRVAQPIVPQGMDFWADTLQVLLLGNILYIGWVTMAQKDLTMMLGYSSVMHMGYLFLGLMAATPLSLQGVVMLMVGHGLSAALLFALAGEIQRRYGTTKISELGGLTQQAPTLALIFSIGAFASIGLPGLANFVGEVMIFFGAWKDYPWITLLALWGVVISAVYMLRAVRSVFYGELSPTTKASTTTGGCLGPHTLLCVALVALGICPYLILNWLGN